MFVQDLGTLRHQSGRIILSWTGTCGLEVWSRDFRRPVSKERYFSEKCISVKTTPLNKRATST